MSNEINPKKFPIIAIGTLCYNTGNFVIEAIESIRKQNYPNINHIIIDDCSTDNSLNIIEEYIRVTNHRCILLKNHYNLGLHASLQKLINHCEGEYVAFLSDDLWPPNKLHFQLNQLLNAGPEYVLAYGDAAHIDSKGAITVASRFEYLNGKKYEILNGDLSEPIASGYGFMIQSCLMKLSALKNCGFVPNAKIISEDIDILICLSQKGFFVGSKEIMSYYRTFEDSGSVSQLLWKEENFYKVCYSNLQLYKKHYLSTKNKRLQFIFYHKSKYWGEKTIENIYTPRFVKIRTKIQLKLIKLFDYMRYKIVS
jgi:glycosyltransferase involved in cell wall biosynthesis